MSDDATEKTLGVLRAGDPRGEVQATWHAKEAVRELYGIDELRADMANPNWPVEVRSMGRTLTKWREAIIAWHRLRISNGPAEAMNLCIKKVKRCGHGLANIPALHTPSTTPHRRHELANPTQTTTHQHPRSPLRCVEPISTKLRLLTRIAFGFGSPEALVALVMLDLGGLCPPLPGRIAA